MADLKISQLIGATTPLAGTETLPVVQSSTTKKVSVADLTNGRLVNAATLQTSGTAAGSFSASKWIVQTEDTTATRSYACGPNTSTFGTFELYLANSNGGPQLGLGMFSTYSVLRAAGVGGIKVDTSGNVSAEAGNFKFDVAGKGIDFSATSEAGGMTSELLNDYEEGTWTPGQGAGLTVVGAFSSAGKYTKIGRAVTLTGYIAGATSVAFAANAVIITGLPYTTDTANGKPVGVGANAANSAISGIEATNTSLNGVVALVATTRFDFTITYTI